LVRGKARAYIDPLSPEATEQLVNLVLDDTCKAIGEENVGRTGKGFYIDKPGFYSSGTVLGTSGPATRTRRIYSRASRSGIAILCDRSCRFCGRSAVREPPRCGTTIWTL
jgi:hypothetical protein